MEVGLRDLKNHLSDYIRRARGGEEIIVTERGRRVARIQGLEEREPRRS
jgi:prevent-host-death family protein